MPFFEILGPKIAALPSDTKKTFVFESNTTVDWDALNASISCVWLHPNGKLWCFTFSEGRRGALVTHSPLYLRSNSSLNPDQTSKCES